MITVYMQVIHHLDTPGNGHPNIRKFVQEAYRVLKPSGAFILNTMSPDQCHPNVLWYYSLVPNVQKHLSQRYVRVCQPCVYKTWVQRKEVSRGGGGVCASSHVAVMTNGLGGGGGGWTEREALQREREITCDRLLPIHIMYTHTPLHHFLLPCDVIV